jgi:MFS superfamily sulfate permease-like transporter
MNLTIPFRPKLFETRKDYCCAPFPAGSNMMGMAFPLPVAFAIVAGAQPESRLFTALMGGGSMAAGHGSRIQMGGPTAALKRVNAGRPSPVRGSRALSKAAPITTLPKVNGKPQP